MKSPKLPQKVIDRLSRDGRSIPFPEEMRSFCCEAQMYWQITGRPSAVFKFCESCNGVFLGEAQRGETLQ